jgi:S-adenosylmethionine:tRNA ribosyltransferase-isomerase
VDVSLFDFDLPETHIALRPAQPRDRARLLVVHADGRIEHRHVHDLPDYMKAGDALVVNDSKVIAARLKGVRAPRQPDGASARIELLLHRRLSANRYSALSRPARKLVPGDLVQFGSLQAQVVARGEAGETDVEFTLSGTALDAAIATEGQMPLPPYIAGKRPTDARDKVDYQTLFARAEGSVAAPTAGLHFTPELMQQLLAKGVTQEQVTLQVGLGTFLPVTATDTDAHRMHAELADLDEAVADRLNAVHAAGGRIAAVGTTSLRTLESAVARGGGLQAFHGETDIFITPGHQFQTADMLLTNFHLPRSTLFMLVCAFSGTDIMKRAYAEAIAAGYRFYSYGDACLLVRTP